MIITYRYRVVDGVLNSSGQALLHHAGEWVELMLLIDFEDTQELPALPQASPALPLHRSRAEAAAARPCHLHLVRIGKQMLTITLLLQMSLFTMEVFNRFGLGDNKRCLGFISW